MPRGNGSSVKALSRGTLTSSKKGQWKFFGEMTLLEGGTRCANIIALEDCQLSVLSFQSFKDIPDTNPGVIALRKIMEQRKKSDALLA